MNLFNKNKSNYPETSNEIIFLNNVSDEPFGDIIQNLTKMTEDVNVHDNQGRIQQIIMDLYGQQELFKVIYRK